MDIFVEPLALTISKVQTKNIYINTRQEGQVINLILNNGRDSTSNQSICCSRYLLVILLN